MPRDTLCAEEPLARRSRFKCAYRYLTWPNAVRPLRFGN